MIKAEQEHHAEVARLSAIIKGLEAENARLGKSWNKGTVSIHLRKGTESYSDLGGPTGSQSEV